MPNRRSFLKKSPLILAPSILHTTAKAINRSAQSARPSTVLPLIVSTWNNKNANQTAWQKIKAGGTILDAVESGINYVESDVNDRSVGNGGRPDRAGKVTLDGCIMDSKGNAGSVCYLQDIEHPISVARMVMEKTPHVMLAGKGAKKFALANGFKKTKLLSKQSKKEYKEWKKQALYKPKVNSELHDTIGMLGINADQQIVGGCSTSGLAYKMEGRVGDSPIIGAGLFVDNEIGAAVATGMGELVMRTCGSFLVVELMRQGNSAQEACEIAVKRIIDSQNTDNLQVGYLAVDKQGNLGAYSIQKGFVYAVKNNTQETVNEANSYFE